jgi:hypothetical protein
MRPFFENNVLQQQPFKPMIIVVDTTKTGSASNTFVLPIIKAASEVVKIYWGDGTNSMGVNGDNTHVYAASGVYTVKIESMLFGGISFNDLGDKAKITKITSFGRGVIRSLATSFFGCSSLTAIDDLTLITIATDATNIFRGCSLLPTIPDINFSKVTSVFAAFGFMPALTTVPLFDFSKVTNAQSAFYGDTALTTVPLLNLSNCTITRSMFDQCTALTTVPLLNLSKVTDATNMFRNCTSLTTIPLLDLSSVTIATNMFLGCTLTTTSYSDFLINLATQPLQSGVSFHGGSSKYNPAAAIARAYLVSNFGWTITDGGAA